MPERTGQVSLPSPIFSFKLQSGRPCRSEISTGRICQLLHRSPWLERGRSRPTKLETRPQPRTGRIPRKTVTETMTRINVRIKDQEAQWSRIRYCYRRGREFHHCEACSVEIATPSTRATLGRFVGAIQLPRSWRRCGSGAPTGDNSREILFSGTHGGVNSLSTIPRYAHCVS